MKAIQIVVDDALLSRVDRRAKQLKSSRSATIRRLVELGLEQEALGALARDEARKYARKPRSKDEAAAFEALSRSQQHVMDDLARDERW